MTWVYHPPGTESASALAVVASIWASCLPNPAFTPDALSSGMNTLDQPSSRRSAPDTSPQPRYGQTSPHSTPNPSVERSTPSLPDTHASLSAWQDSAKGPTIQGTFGPTSHGSPANLVMDCDGSSSKMYRAMPALALTPCCESYETWVSRLRLAYSQRKKSARRTKGSGGSAWPTAKTRDHHAESRGENPLNFSPSMAVKAEIWPTPMAGTPAQNGNAAAGNNDFSRKAEAMAAAMWTTPQAHDVTQRGSGQKPTAKAGNACLATDAQQWPSPQARDFRSGDNPASPRQVRKLEQGWSQNLNDVAEAPTWPTPAAQNWKGSSPDSITRSDGKSRMDILHYRAEQGFSRPAPAMHPHGVTLSQLRPIWCPLRASVIASHGRATWRRLWKSRAKRRLNPLFVEWLMGWPPGHALCACSEMELSHWQQRMRGALSQLPMASGPWIWMEPAQQPILTQANLFGDM